MVRFAQELGSDWHHSKVSGWVNRKAMPSAEALVAIARRFDVTTDWLLGAHEAAPQHPAQWRSEAALEDDLAAHVTREALMRLEGITEPWLVEVLDSMLHGETLLDHLVRVATEDLKANAAFFRQKAEAAKQMHRLEMSAASGTPVDADELLAILRRLYSQSPPAGSTTPWRPVSIKRSVAERPPAIGRK